jgi:hypothetical protein
VFGGPKLSFVRLLRGRRSTSKTASFSLGPNGSLKMGTGTVEKEISPHCFFFSQVTGANFRPEL